jgi:hypothetical protein
MPVGAGVGQLDGSGGEDLVVGVRDKHDCEDFENNHAWLYAIRGTGSLMWKRQDTSGGNPLTYTHAIIHDVDGNGQKDVLWADWNTQGHKCGNWEVTGPANFYRYDAAGNRRWKVSLGTFWNNKDLALADVDGDGVQEVLANGPNGGHDGIWYLDSRSGARETWISAWPWKVTRGPVVADLWNTGTMQWVIPVGAWGAGTSGGAIMVFDTHQPYNAAWPHMPYPSLGEGPVPPPPPPPPPGGFQATFIVPDGINSWWVEVDVQANEPVTAVHARVNGGNWVALNPTSWGSWAKSFHVDTGACVEFRATSSTGATNQSAGVRWLQGTPCSGGTTPPPPPPPPPGDFTATFEPRAVGNDWWIEARVTANEPLAGVQGRVNSGTWHDLSATSWGTWAKSVNAPNGSQVQFQARSTTGATALSSSSTWT